MVGGGRIWMIAALLGITAGQGSAQQAVPPLPPAPLPVAPGAVQAPAPLPAPRPATTLGTPLPPTGSPYVAPATPLPSPAPAPYAAPTPPPLFAPPDPGRDGWGPYGLPSDFPTVFFGADLYFLQPSIAKTLQATQTLPGGGTKTYSTPHVDLDFTVSPRIELGWRLPDCQGQFSVAYRLIASDGNGTVSDPVFGAMAGRSRLNMNIVDFDYASARYAPFPTMPRVTMQWRFGARVETVFFDNQASNAVFSEKASNYFVGAGPHAGLELSREIALITGLAVFGNIDGGIPIGQVRQNYSETVGGVTSNFSQNRTQSSYNLTLQTGLSYVPPGMPHLRFQTGFQYERFWDVGKVGAATGDVQDYGGFIGGRFDY